MATRLDQQIEQLEKMVEKRLDLCQVTRNGTRCCLPANHEPKDSHKFPIEFSTNANPAEQSQRLCRGGAPARRGAHHAEAMRVGRPSQK
jgi:hypothetical protein